MATQALPMKLIGPQNQTICTSPLYAASIKGDPGIEHTELNPCHALVQFNVHYVNGNLRFDALAILKNKTQACTKQINDDKIWISYSPNVPNTTNADIKSKQVSHTINKIGTFDKIIMNEARGTLTLDFTAGLINPADNSPTLNVRLV